jgi:hypothetical protein
MQNMPIPLYPNPLIITMNIAMMAAPMMTTTLLWGNQTPCSPLLVLTFLPLAKWTPWFFKMPLHVDINHPTTDSTSFPIKAFLNDFLTELKNDFFRGCVIVIYQGLGIGLGLARVSQLTQPTAQPTIHPVQDKSNTQHSTPRFHWNGFAP